ncbi:MAG: glutathione S-transferase family protein [Hyphomicrobium sp.]
MYVLYGFPGSRTTRVTWMIEEIGADYEFVATRPHSKIAYSVNPSGKLPALKVDSETIVDSIAICSYLADCHPEAGLTYSPGTIERAQMESWLQFAALDLEAPLWMFNRQTMILPKPKRTPGILDVCTEDWANALKAMAARLGENTYAMGERFTVADVVLGHIGRWAAQIKYPIEPQSVSSYFDRVQRRPALARALERESAAATALA